MPEQSANAWRPLLDGEDAARAKNVVEAIATELDRRGPELIGGLPDSLQAGLAGGASGLALFFAYLFEATGEEHHAQTALAFLDRAADLLAEAPTVPHLYTGFTGVAWTLEHLDGRLFEADGEAANEADESGEAEGTDRDADDEMDANADIDAALSSFLVRPFAATEYDLLQGLAGFGVYAAERLPRPAGRACLARVIDLLAGIATRDDLGAAWFSPPERLPEHQRELYPEGHFNLGVAHGLPGVLPVLAAAVAAGVDAERASELLTGAVSWLLEHRRDAGDFRFFPYAVVAGAHREEAPSRLAWCYGDPGVAGALFAAGRGVGNDAWQESALEVAVASAERPEASSGVRDAGLCHGSAGLAHLYNRLWHATGHPRLAEAARFWFRHCLDFGAHHRQEGRGVAGFPSWEFERASGEFDWSSDPGFLTGAAGVGLALLAGLGTGEPEWDRVLALSVRPI